MTSALDSIEELLGTKDDATWQTYEAMRLMTLIQTGQLGPERIEDAAWLVTQALKTRPMFYDLNVLQGDIQYYKKNLPAAIECYEKALDYGPGDSKLVEKLVVLYLDTDNLEKAKRLLNRRTEDQQSDLLDQIDMLVKYQSGDAAQTIALAQERVLADPDNLSKRLAYAVLLQNGGKNDEAERQYEQAVEKGPGLAQPWLALIQFLISANRQDEAEAARRRATLSLSEDVLPSFQARAYQMLGRTDDAEREYLKEYNRAPDDPAMNRTLAWFYLSDGYPKADKVKVAKAMKYITALIEYGDSAKVEGASQDPNVIWARQTIAKLIAANGDYRQFQMALAFIDKDKVDGKLSIDDQILKATILAARPEPISRRQAMDILTKLRDERTLPATARLVLAELYLKAGDWTHCRTTLEEIVSRNPTDANLIAKFAFLLEGHDELNAAAKYLVRLQEIAPDSAPTIELKARLQAKRESLEAATRTVVAWAPSSGNIKDVTRMLNAAAILERLGAKDAAYDYYKDAYNLDPKTNILVYAAFLGRAGSAGREDKVRLDEAFSVLDQAIRDGADPMQVLNLSLSIVRERKDSVSRQYDVQIERWLLGAKVNYPDDYRPFLVEAEFRDLQGKHGETVKVYQDMLNRKDVTGQVRALVLNNLAYNLAMQDRDLPEALAHIEQSITVLGPSGDLLDTRAMVYLAIGRIDDAKNDLELSIKDNATPIKHVHLALVYAKAKEIKQARNQLQIARDLGLKPNGISSLEQRKYQELLAALGQTAPVSTQIRPAPVTFGSPAH